MIFNIQRFSTHDGSGIRTIIFYKGCPLRCLWCSNPESQSPKPDILFDRRICKHFGDCMKVNGNAVTLYNDEIQIDRSAVSNPEIFRNVCISKALTVTGEDKSTDDLLAEIEKDLPFYRQSRGGVTLSGGEPLSQGQEVVNLLQELQKRGIDVSVETCLHVTWKKVERCLGLVGTFLVDLKHTDKDKFHNCTQGDIGLVLDNLRKLAATRSNIIIRIPVIPGFNHSDQEMKQIIGFAASLDHVAEIHLIPYHNLGIEKYNMLGMDYTFGNKKPVDPAELTGYIEYAHSKGFKTKIGG
jgi:pyruvate formate lyase activating enzyme